MNRELSCIAIDDEPMALLVIEQFCRRNGNIVLSTYSEPLVGMEEIKRRVPDLVFLDIQMNSITGLDIAKELPAKCCLIFTTAHAKYAIDGFELDAVDFLHKPFSYDRFKTAVEKAIRRIESLSTHEEGNIIVKCEYSNVKISLGDISYIEAVGNYVKIVCTSGERILSRTTLKSVQSMLPEESFIRVHRSFIVAKSQVSSFTRTRIILKGDKEIPVGVQYVNDIRI